jgi:hypothetical protein
VYIFSLVIVFVIAGVLGLTAQVKIQKKPVDNPSVTQCNTNGNCEYEELDTNKSLERQPCPDCLPQSYGQLFFDLSPQIAGIARASLDPQDWRPGRAIQIRYTGNPDPNGFEIQWQSDLINQVSHGVLIGDIDNDGVAEIGAIDLTVVTEGKGKNKKNYYHHDLLIFEENDWTEPSARLDLADELVSGVVDGALLANVDYDDDNELIVFKSSTEAGHFEVYKLYQDPDTGIYSLTRVYYDVADYNTYVLRDGGIWNVEVGNVDSDPENEILLARFRTTRPYILNFDPLDPRFWVPVPDEDIQPLDFDETFENMPGEINFNVFRIGDVDADGANEIVAGGNNDRLMIWNYDAGSDYYFKSFVSPDLNPDENSFTWAMDLGNIDFDSDKEIILGLGGRRLGSDFIRIFDFVGTSYTEIPVQPMAETIDIGLDDLRVVDFDGDGIVEVVTGQHGISVFKYLEAPARWERVFNYALGNSFKLY